MPSENSPSQNSELSIKLTLLRVLDSGVIDSIQCPQCLNGSVSVWFTHPLANEYRTWFTCEKCSFRMRVQNSERPRYFIEGRVDQRLDTYDTKILQKKRLS